MSNNVSYTGTISVVDNSSHVIGPHEGAGSGDAHPTTSHILAYVFVPLGSLVLVAVLAVVAVFIFRKSKLDKLRHHLMPLYSFDPGDEAGDWESELLEDQDDVLRLESPSSNSPVYSPKLKLKSNRRDDIH